MTTARPVNDPGVAHDAGTSDHPLAKIMQHILDAYRYDAIQILIHILHRYEDIDVFTRRNQPRTVEGKVETQPPADAMQLRQGYLYQGLDFHVIDENSWDYMTPEFIERDARMAESFGLPDLAAVARRRIR